MKAPRWVSFFAWSAGWERILIVDNLKRRGANEQVGVVCVGVMVR